MTKICYSLLALALIHIYMFLTDLPKTKTNHFPIFCLSFQNLSNWRSRRKSASAAVYQRAVQAEEMEKEKEKEQEDIGRRKSKTWKEMQENRYVLLSYFVFFCFM